MVEHPEARMRLLDTLQALADPDHQRRIWVERSFPHPDYYEDLDLHIHQLYDDSDVAEDPRGHIGYTLRNEDEARAMENLNAVLSPLIDSLPPDVDDATVIAMPEWQAVIAAARQALRAFPESDSAD
jgi:hypothetical protein